MTRLPPSTPLRYGLDYVDASAQIGPEFEVLHDGQPHEHFMFDGPATATAYLCYDLAEIVWAARDVAWLPPLPWPVGGLVNRAVTGNRHRDRTNSLRSTHVVVALRDGETRGGALSIPWLGVTFEMQHGAVVTFDAQFYEHAVSPLAGTGRRTSVVFYAPEPEQHGW